MVALVNVEILLLVLQASKHWDGLLFFFFFLIYIYIYSSELKNFCGYQCGSKHVHIFLLSYFLMGLCVSWICAEYQGTSEIVCIKRILKKGVGLPELRIEAFAIPALSWCSAGSTNYSLLPIVSWHLEELVMGIPFLKGCWLRAVAMLYLSVNWDRQGYGAVVPSKQ